MSEHLHTFELKIDGKTVTVEAPGHERPNFENGRYQPMLSLMEAALKRWDKQNVSIQVAYSMRCSFGDDDDGCLMGEVPADDVRLKAELKKHGYAKTAVGILNGFNHQMEASMYAAFLANLPPGLAQLLAIFGPDILEAFLDD